MNFIYYAITLEYLWFSLILALSKNNMGCKGRQQLKVIGVGLPRTGTTSMAIALAELLNCADDQIHHGMKIQSLTDKQLNFWLKLFNTERQVNDEEIKDYFDDFQAVLDIPVILFWKDLKRIYPNAKFVLTVRNADSMFESWHKTIGESLRILQHPIYRWFLHENPLVSNSIAFSAGTSKYLKITFKCLI